MLFASLLWAHLTFCHFPPFPQADCALSGADSQVGGLVYILGSRGPLQWTLLWDWEFLPLPLPPPVFTDRGFEALIFPCWSPGLWGLSRSLVVPPGLSACKCGISWSITTTSPSLVSQLPPCYAPSPPWLPVSAPPTSVDDCFFFNSLVVGFPYSLIFW